jgi:hypothetical protein
MPIKSLLENWKFGNHYGGLWVDGEIILKFKLMKSLWAFVYNSYGAGYV